MVLREYIYIVNTSRAFDTNTPTILFMTKDTYTSKIRSYWKPERVTLRTRESELDSGHPTPGFFPLSSLLCQSPLVTPNNVSYNPSDRLLTTDDWGRSSLSRRRHRRTYVTMVPPDGIRTSDLRKTHILHPEDHLPCHILIQPPQNKSKLANEKF